MTCENQTIAEMLVPYVEGALAEADRLEVTEHLRHCLSCRDEARRLREGILAVRHLFASGYRPRLLHHIAVEEIVAFSVDPGSLSDSVRQNLELHLLECEACSQEVALLQGLHRELEGRVSPGASPLLLPRALREEVERVFPGAAATSASSQVAQDLPMVERLAALWSRFNWRPALATIGAALLLTVGFLFTSSGPSQDVAVKSAFSPPVSVQGLPSSPSPAPAEVALTLSPGQIEQVAPLLDREGVPWQNRGGIIYVLSADLQKARNLVETGLSEQRVADASPNLPAPTPTPEVQPDPSPTTPSTPSPTPHTPSPTPSPRPLPSPSARSPVLVAQVPPPATPAPRLAKSSTAVRRAPAPAPTTARPAALPTSVQTEQDAPVPRIVALGEGGGSQSATRAPGAASNQAAEMLDTAPPTPALEVQAKAPGPSTVRSAESAGPVGGSFEPAPSTNRVAAIESQARQIVGEGSVSVEGGGEGPVHVIVRPHRSLNTQEKEDLRRRLRRDLGLRDSDTITIR